MKTAVVRTTTLLIVVAGADMKFVHSMRGLGDNIYQRAFVKAMRAEHIVLDISWPQLYSDMPHVECVKPVTSLRTQAKNINRYKWTSKFSAPRTKVGVQVRYDERGIIACMRQAFGHDPAPMDLPVGMYLPLDGLPSRSYVVVRPVTVREEWRADSRNPDPVYVAEAASLAGLPVVSIADLAPGMEWALDPLPKAKFTYHTGELDVTKLMRLVANARFVIGGIGWIVPACYATGTPAWIICGGQGGYNSPSHISVPGNETNIKYAVPDKFCGCREKTHNCDKRIKEHGDKFLRFVSELG